MAEGITHIDTSTTAPKLADGVVLLQDLPGVGEAPGVTAYVHYNGPTDQLATLCNRYGCARARGQPSSSASAP